VSNLAAPLAKAGRAISGVISVKADRPLSRKVIFTWRKNEMRDFSVVFALAFVTAGALAPVSAQNAPTRAKSDPNRLICRSSVETGSLARRERRCFTRAQWDEQAERNQRVGFELQENLRGKPCGDPSGGC
jgi:hypothetical protein